MSFPDPSWAGTVTFAELLFGTWLSYISLVLMWKFVLKKDIEEWQYTLVTFFGGSFFLINHYFLRSPFYFVLIIGYSVVFLIIHHIVLARLLKDVLWKKISIGLLIGIIFSLLYIFYEWIVRWGNRAGIHEFWFMLISFFGFIFLILWRAGIINKTKKHEGGKA